ncbi:FCD domain-containing protein [Bradyrhizobium sp. dw_78]|uniref:GntR family transcriptional regulator n=1 Tax=Bradyrhizobium sp. dw_78 TaxID=2719793 RepID=UPI001BD302DC|nr:FCD domain-containing protein [Bradyrhizobium sp. dw_78]
MIAADAMPWATSSLYWKRQELDRSSASSASAYVLARMRGDILSAYFRPGAKLYLKILMARYATSVAPVREALAVLSGAGLVISESQRGFRVAPASRADLIDVAALRMQLEVTALQLSIERGGLAWVEGICSVYEGFSHLSQKAGQHTPISDVWESYHREFHFSLIAACGSPTLLNFCSQLHDRFDRYRRLTLPYGSYMAGTAGDHEEIKDAAIRRDTRRAVALIRQHIQSITDIVLERYDADEGYGSCLRERGATTP